ncbi:MAG: TRAP transporter substrate-binding protein DctP [Alphaproteobacteria bacterium]|nr:TRAP transporter substrate-binding protein DctP [Alphaproteobacteria bacterium]
MRFIIIVAVAVGMFTSSAAHAQVKVLVNIFVGPAHFIHAPYKAWGAEVAKVTDGRVTVDFLPASAAPPPKQIEGALGGSFDGAFMFNGFNGKRAPFTQMLLLPFLMEGNAEAGSVATWRTYEKYFNHLGQFEKLGITPLSYFQFPGGHFFSSGDPILSIADLKKRKMWALAGTPTRVLKLAGVDHVAGPAARLAEFVQNNTVEGVAGISQDAIITFGGLQFTNSATVRSDARLGVPNFIMFLTTKKWEEISDTDQAAIRNISGETFARAVGKAADVAETKRRQQLLDKGVKIVETPESFKNELLEVSAPLFEAWKKSAAKMGVKDAQAPIDFYKAETAKAAAGS